MLLENIEIYCICDFKEILPKFLNLDWKGNQNNYKLAKQIHFEI